jgi:hypothetical protein
MLRSYFSLGEKKYYERGKARNILTVLDDLCGRLNSYTEINGFFEILIIYYLAIAISGIL